LDPSQSIAPRQLEAYVLLIEQLRRIKLNEEGGALSEFDASARCVQAVLHYLCSDPLVRSEGLHGPLFRLMRDLLDISNGVDANRRLQERGAKQHNRDDAGLKDESKGGRPEEIARPVLRAAILVCHDMLVDGKVAEPSAWLSRQLGANKICDSNRKPISSRQIERWAREKGEERLFGLDRTYKDYRHRWYRESSSPLEAQNHVKGFIKNLKRDGF
jgi:hypothetical protein